MDQVDQKYLEYINQQQKNDKALSLLSAMNPEERTIFLNKLGMSDIAASNAFESRRQYVEKSKEPELEGSNLEVFMAATMPIFTAVAGALGIGASKITGTEELSDLFGNIAAMIINPEEGAAKLTEKYGEKAPKIIEKVQELMKGGKVPEEKLSKELTKILERNKFIKEPSDAELRVMKNGTFINSTTEKQFNSAIKIRTKRLKNILEAYKSANPEEQMILKEHLSGEFTKYMQLQIKEVEEWPDIKKLVKHKFTTKELNKLTESANDPDFASILNKLLKPFNSEIGSASLITEDIPKRMMVFAKNLFNTNNIHYAQVNALLMNPKIWAGKALIDLVNQTLIQIPSRAIGAAAHYKSLDVGSHVLLSSYYAFKEALPDAIMFMKATFLSGEPEFEKFLGIRRPQTFLQDFNNTDIGRLSNWLGAFYTSGPRAILSIDQFAKVPALRANMNTLAYFHALDEIGESIAGAEKYRLAERMARSSVETQPDWLMDASIQKMWEDTFTDKTSVSRAINGLANMEIMGAKPLKNLLIFTTTPYNVYRQGMKLTPLGFISGAEKMFKGQGLDGSIDMARASVGTAFGAWVAWETLMGNIVGSGPNNPVAYEIWRRTHIPHSAWGHETGHLGNVGVIMSLAADTATFYADAEPSNQMRLVNATSGALYSSVAHAPFMYTLENLVHTIDSYRTHKEPISAAMSQFIGRQATTLIPAPVGIVADVLDPSYHQARSIVDEIKEKIPGYSSTVPPALDTFGYPQYLPPGLSSDETPPAWYDVLLNQLSPIGTSQEHEMTDIDKEFARVRFTGSRIPNHIHNNGEVSPITTEQQHEWGELSGHKIEVGGLTQQESMEKLIKNKEYLNSTIDQQKKMLNEQHTLYRNWGKDAILQKYYPTLGTQQPAETNLGGQPAETNLGGQPGPTVIPVQKSLEDLRLGE